MDTKILLENGTNELEILEFTLAGNSYGINVAKIKEIITYQPVTPVPNSHPSIEGIFMPRDTMITAIDLKNCLGRGESEKKGLFIVTNFNKLDIAFHRAAHPGGDLVEVNKIGKTILPRAAKWCYVINCLHLKARTGER